MMECNTNRDNFLNNSWTIFNKAPPPHSSRIIVNPLSGEWRTPDIEPISTTKKSALNQRAALSVHVPLRGGGRANTGTMRIVHDLSSFTQQPSIKPFLLEITCPVNWIIPSLLYTPHIPPLSSRSTHVWSRKFGFATRSTATSSLRDNRIFTIPFPSTRRWGRKRGLIFLRKK